MKRQVFLLNQPLETVKRLINHLGQGPYFLFTRMCLVDIHFAPFAVRLSRLGQPFKGWALPPGPRQLRWQRWLDALERDPHVRCTMSSNGLYAKSVGDLLGGFRGGLTGGGMAAQVSSSDPTLY